MKGSAVNSRLVQVLVIRFICLISFAVFFSGSSAFAQTQSTICAVVKIEIVQELTIERQAFEATLDIENVLVDRAINDIRVVVDFQDEDGNPVIATSDPNDTNANFFIRVSNMDGIDDVDGSGVLEGGEVARVTWLIIPAPGSSEGIPSGKLYFVGASFQYTLDGIADAIEVAPDTIFVRPLPLLSLDYFLPRDVFADNPLTSDIEPVEPFTLGVRVQNNGQGVGKNIKIESAQPRIVENDQGLLIDFRLLNSFVQNEPVNNSLLIEFGDIPAGESKMGRWNMETSLSGRFTEFSAEYSHADELGGQLTSLLEGVNTHTLVRDVLVDLPGRDNIKDFLAFDIFDPLSDALFGLQVYESDSTTSVVENQSNDASLTSSGSDYQVQLNPSPSFVYAQLDDPFSGGKSVSRVVRSDGKEVSLNNVWFSKSYNRTSQEVSYHFNIFDAGTTGQYQVEFADLVVEPRPPVIQFIPLRQTAEEGLLSFVIEASDPDGTIPTLSLDNPPIGVSFNDQGNGTGFFTWQPSIGQAGRYDFDVVATDAELTATRRISIIVNSGLDTDGDGILDTYELEHFGDLSKDGQDDTDGDGVSDFDEFERGTDPNTVDGPQAPIIIYPAIEDVVSTKTPELLVENSEYVGNFDLVYAFEVYLDENYTELVDAFYSQPENEEEGETAFQTIELDEDTRYYWRVRSFDSFTYSPWVNGSFTVNSENSLPLAPTIKFPEIGQEVMRDQLSLKVNSVVDGDGDQLFYTFYLYEDSDGSAEIAQSTPILEVVDGSNEVSWNIPESIVLEEGREYYWQVAVVDVSAESVLSQIFSFSLALGNNPPGAPVIVSPAIGERVVTATPTLTVENIIDQNLGGGLSYFFEIDTQPSFDSANKLVSGWLISSNDQQTFSWVVSEQLAEDTQYFWRVKARDSQLNESEWSISASLNVNAINQAPPVPVVKNPGAGAEVITLTPKLEVFPSLDADQDQVQYEFRLFADSQEQQLIVSTVSDDPVLLLSALDDDRHYYWQVRAIDENSEFSDWSELSSFFVNENDFDNPPEFTWLAPESSDIASGETVELRWEDEDADSSARISLFYADNPEGVGRVLITSNVSEDEDFAADSYTWSSNGLNVGIYYFFAVIEDETSVIAVEAEEVFTVNVKPFVSMPLVVESVSGDGQNLELLTDSKFNEAWLHSTAGKSILEFDFGSIKRVDQVRIAFGLHWRAKYLYTIELSDDGMNWQIGVNNKRSNSRYWDTSNFNNKTARFVRLTINSGILQFSDRQQFLENRQIHEVQFTGGDL